MILWYAGIPLPNYTTFCPKNSTHHSHHHETLKPHITFTCLHVLYTCYLSGIYRMSQEVMSIFWEVTVSVILSKILYMYICPIPNGFWEWAISLYSCKIVDKEILSIVSNIGIYWSSDKVGAVYLVQYIFENSAVNISSGTTIAKAVNVRHINIFGICEDVWHFTQHSYNAISISHSHNSSGHSHRSQQPTDASHRFTCFIQWLGMAGVKDSIGRQIQTPVQWNGSMSETIWNRTHVHVHFFA